jgi:hypothetical protein
MTQIEYRELRAAAEKVKRKVNNREQVSSAELEVLRQYAALNPSAASIGSYALCKKLVQDEGGNE